ncbi:hypothetical protein [Leifsonia sp. NPDC058230]|uniref:hypothetical protein n=1 Tax=Leifsonia sp. NPDC058230 TaxID=3346391 RepID=UPI0036DDE6FC
MSDIESKRPGGVTLVGVLTYLKGFFDLISGVLLVVFASVGEVQQSVGGAWVTGILLIVIGLIVVSVASILLRGNRTARTVIAIVQVVSIAANVYSMFVGASVVGAIVSIVVSLVVLGLLFLGKAPSYFARNGA